jgi:hypothetical protein
MADSDGASALVRVGEQALAKVEKGPAIDAARAELQQARARLSHAARSLKADLTWIRLPVKVTASMKKMPLLWLGGAFVLGALLGTLTRGFPRRDDGDE